MPFRGPTRDVYLASLLDGTSSLNATMKMSSRDKPVKKGLAFLWFAKPGGRSTKFCVKRSSEKQTFSNSSSFQHPKVQVPIRPPNQRLHKSLKLWSIMKKRCVLASTKMISCFRLSLFPSGYPYLVMLKMLLQVSCVCLYVLQISYSS